MFGYKKKQNKKRQCSLFAICGRQQRALCRLPRTAKRPLPSVADGKEAALPPFILFFLISKHLTANI